MASKVGRRLQTPEEAKQEAEEHAIACKGARIGISHRDPLLWGYANIMRHTCMHAERYREQFILIKDRLQDIFSAAFKTHAGVLPINIMVGQIGDTDSCSTPTFFVLLNHECPIRAIRVGGGQKRFVLSFSDSTPLEDSEVAAVQDTCFKAMNAFYDPADSDERQMRFELTHIGKNLELICTFTEVSDAIPHTDLLRFTVIPVIKAIGNGCFLTVPSASGDQLTEVMWTKSRVYIDHMESSSMQGIKDMLALMRAIHILEAWYRPLLGTVPPSVYESALLKHERNNMIDIQGWWRSSTFRELMQGIFSFILRHLKEEQPLASSICHSHDILESARKDPTAFIEYCESWISLKDDEALLTRIKTVVSVCTSHQPK